MFGIIYIVLSLLAGKELAEILLFTGKNAQEAGSRNGQHKAFCNQIWVLAAATFGMGTLVFGWTTYMISWAASEAGAKKPLIYGNTAVLIITAVVLVLLYWKRYRKTGTVWTVADRKLISDSRAFRKECILFGFLLVFLTWIMFYVFYIRNGELNRGFLGGMINEYTRFDPTNDNRQTLPRFQPEAIRANYRIVEVLNAFGRTRGITPAQVALAWLMNKKTFIVPIPGTTKLSHLEENLRACDIVFTAEEMNELEKAVTAIPVMGSRYDALQESKIQK